MSLPEHFFISLCGVKEERDSDVWISKFDCDEFPWMKSEKLSCRGEKWDDFQGFEIHFLKKFDEINEIYLSHNPLEHFYSHFTRRISFIISACKKFPRNILKYVSRTNEWFFDLGRFISLDFLSEQQNFSDKVRSFCTARDREGKNFFFTVEICLKIISRRRKMLEGVREENFAGLIIEKNSKKEKSWSCEGKNWCWRFWDNWKVKFWWI